MNIVKNGRSFRFFNEIEILKELPVANYELVWDPFGNCSLEKITAFSFPEKVYDIEEGFREQVLTTFNAIDKNVGVLLEGYKGQGKSLTAKKLCVESQVPVILITKPIPTSVNFVSFLNDIHTNYVLFIDEFEKIFKDPIQSSNQDQIRNHTQDIFLSFMDGAISSGYKKMFLLTTNSPIGDKFVNRPSRIRYYKKYEFMASKLFDIVMEDKLVSKDFETDLRDNLPLIDCTIDLLSTIIEEINLHNKPYSAFKDFFNHKPKKVTYSRYKFDPVKKTFDYKDSIEETRELTRESLYIGGNHQTQVLKVEDGYIFYKAKEYVVTAKSDDDEDDDPKASYQDVIYRLNKSEGAKYAF
jgi:hypothetical protein